MASLSASAVLDRLRMLRVVPVLVVADPVDVVPLGRALMDGGLPCAEITFRTPGAAEALRRMAETYPAMLVGAGTVLTPQVARQAAAAGAQFVVTPGLNPAVVDACRTASLPILPGVCTPTEIEMGLGLGLDVFKFFPAEPLGGLSYLEAIAAPYAGVQFVPTGGIRPQHLASYLAREWVVACGGSWMAPAAWVAARQFDRVRAETARTVSVAAGAPEGGQ